MNHFAKYPWDLWCNGETHVVDPAAWNLTLPKLQQRLHVRARGSGLLVVTNSTMSGKLMFAFLKWTLVPEEPEVAVVPPNGWTRLAWPTWCDGSVYELELEDLGHLIGFQTEFGKQARKRMLDPWVLRVPKEGKFILRVQATKRTTS